MDENGKVFDTVGENIRNGARAVDMLIKEKIDALDHEISSLQADVTENKSGIKKNSDDIGLLNEDLEVLNEFIIYENLNWEQGVIDGKGIIQPCTTRIYTPVYYPLKYFINRRINIDSDYEYAISCCDENGNAKDNLFGYLDINKKSLVNLLYGIKHQHTYMTIMIS